MNPLWFFVILATVNGSEDTEEIVCDTGAWPAAKWGDGTDGLVEVKFLKFLNSREIHIVI